MKFRNKRRSSYYFIKHGADPIIKDGYGYTACERAKTYQLNTIEQLNNIVM